ncbi:unnamed protein product, partial [Mesorhabditis belari]|uniref:Major sperm protein n=1 Tax=Mesorhabditis belari TaxID=2138241 RepID=A0AAF3EFA1_9BILA
MVNFLSKSFATLDRKDHIFAAGVLAIFYAFCGGQSHVFCEILLGAIPAAFTYKVLLCQDELQKGYRSLLFFWVMHGLFSSSVHFFNPTSSFFFLKYATLGLFFLSALNENKEVLQTFDIAFPQLNEEGLTKEKRAKSAFVDTTECTQMPTKHQNDVPQPLLNETMITTSTALDSPSMHFQQAEHFNLQPIYPFQPAPNNYALTSPPPFWSYNQQVEQFVEQESASYLNLRPIIDEKSYDEQKTLVETNDAAMDLKADCNGEEKEDGGIKMNIDQQTKGDKWQHSRHVASGDITNQSSFCTIPLGYDDIDTKPSRLIKFVGRSVGAQSNIFVVNTSQQNVMWALKTNALDRLQASPTCGIIPVEETTEIKFAISESCDEIVSGSDKVAIDYAFISSSTTSFDKTQFEKMIRRRHLMRVSFDG